MCTRYSYYASADTLKNRFGVEDMDWEPAANYNVGPTQFVPVVLKERNR